MYDHVVIKGDLNLNNLYLIGKYSDKASNNSISIPIRINESTIDGNL